MPPLSAQLVIPASAAHADAPSMRGLAGIHGDHRMQILIDEAHLTAWLGRDIRGLTFRRDGADTRAFDGGSATLTVALSHAPHDARSAQHRLRANHDPNGPLTAFSGRVTIPDSPALGSAPPTWSDRST